MQVDPTTTKSWLFSVVYGSPNAHLRKKLFADLTSDSHHPDIPWLVVGDFNSVLSSDETSSPENFSINRSSDFKNWIFREGLIDLGFTGSKFTWKRGIDTPSFKGARIDMELGNIAWKISFPNSLVEHLPMINSDHSPILVNSEFVSQASSTKSFRFNLAWSTHPSFLDCVKKAWCKGGNLESNKAALAKSLAAWNKGTFGNIFHKKKRLLAIINGVQCSLATRPRADLFKLDRKLRIELEDVLYQEELLWFQRSREEWIESGDRNTHFYHTATATKTNSASLKHIKDENGQHLTSDTQIRDHIFNFFVNSFSEICPFVSSNLQDGILPEACNDTLITLIPKVSCPESVKHLRLIGLSNLSYKLLTKLMVMRLKAASKKLIGPHQTSFVPERQITDNVIVYQELLNSMRTKKGPRGHWKGVMTTRDGPLISHLFFADDMVLFDEATLAQASEMKACLEAFCTSSGLKMNIQKSSVFFSRNTLPSLQESSTNLIGISKVEDPGKYLGMPSIHGRLKQQAFSGILERVQSRLAGWKSKTLSLAGRQVLAQSVLSAIPYYSMQSVPLPAGIIDSIEKQIRGFLWGSSEGSRKIHLISWDVVTQSKQCGGPGIRRLREMNQAFLAKLGWRMLHEKDNLWFNSLLPEDILDQLTAVIISNDPEDNDSLGWRHEPSGKFTTSSAYDAALRPPTMANDVKWMSIWKLKVPNKICIFIWTAMHGKILTNSNRYKRCLSECDKCIRCPTKTEDTQHVLRDCPAAKEVLEIVLPYLSMDPNLPFEDWMTIGIRKSGGSTHPSNISTLFATTLWWIWRWRNDAVFNNQEKSLSYKVEWIQTQAEETPKAFRKTRTPLLSSWSKLCWTKPPAGIIKINIDASVDLMTSRAGCGGVARDDSGSWLAGFTYNIGICSPLVAEAWALLKGIQLAKHLDFRDVIFETDSKEISESVARNQ
ncbi:PREDICTED: uncharacterized protein LOC109191482 [Ipomoea nil]|uniref:uncharacterized protein LOC109191482 n=1 Tax=Ipomoea nil TaxID=35883 RepID=UPI0009008AF1|nr:PREDICTED: uncharacterized protein LOC109191482 [Ipomoea nil]